MRLTGWTGLVLGMMLTAGAGCSGGSLTQPEQLRVSLAAPSDVMLDGSVVTWEALAAGGSAPLNFDWSFGGGGTLESAGAPVSSDGEVLASARVLLHEGDWTARVTVTDRRGQTASASANFAVESATLIHAAATYANGRITVAADGHTETELTVTPVAPPAFQIGAPQFALVNGQRGALLPVRAVDELAGASGAIVLNLSDALGRTGQATIEVDIAANLEPDTLYARALVRETDVGQPVTVIALTGPLPRTFYKAAFGFVVPADAELVPGSFNAGAPGGAASDGDGIWQDVSSTVELFSEITPGEIYWEGNSTEKTAYFALAPVGGQEIADAQGVLFNLQLTFSTPGEKRFRFHRRSGFEHWLTFYTGFGPQWGMWGDGYQTLWGTLAGDSGASALIVH